MHKKKSAQKTQSSSELSANDKALLDSMIESVETMDKDTIPSRHLSPRLAVALVERLPLDSARTPELLECIVKIYQQKEVRKAVKRTLFKMKQRGVAIPDVNLEEPPAFRLRTVQQDKPEAYVGPIDGTGSRPVLIAIPQLPQGIGLGVGVINDERGILEYVFGRYSKKQAKEMQTLFFEKLPFMVETSLSHATALLEEAHVLRSEKGEASGDYNQIREWLLGHVQRPGNSNSPVYEILPYESISREVLTDSQIQKLLAHPLLAGWIAQPDKLKSVADEVARAEKSPILLSGIQKGERINQVKEDSIRQLYDGKQRNLMKRRLEEMAYLFGKSGEENLARICLRCALSFLERDSLLKVNAFLKALMEKSLLLYFSGTGFSEASVRESAPPSRILVP
jgi:hypothetical protein